MVKRFDLLLGTVWSNFAVKLEASVVSMNDLRANTVCIQVSPHFSIRVHFSTGMLLNLQVPKVTKIKFLPTLSIQSLEKRL